LIHAELWSDDVNGHIMEQFRKICQGVIILVVGLKKRFVSQHVIKRNAFGGKNLESFSREN
jgi:hypothetical protein